jgi:tetratricopeptide (TPR) repeat protein
VPADQTKPESKQLARQVLFCIADLVSVARRVEQVPAAYERILQNASPDDEALGRLAAWWKTQSNHDKARETYRRYADAFAGVGQVANSFREQARYDEAIQTYQQVAAQDNERRVSWKSELALTYRYAKKWPEAVAVYEELVKDDLANANRWRWEVACTFRDSGNYPQAIGNFRQCTNFPENYQQMAWCHRQAKQHNEAIILYQQIAGGSQPHAPWAMLQIAYTREEAGEKEPAIQAFQQVCSHASAAHAHLQQQYKISVTLGGAAEE